MADTITIPVDVGIKINKKQLNNLDNLNKKIENLINNTKGLKTKDFLKPITTSANTLTKSFVMLQSRVTNLTNSFSGLKSEKVSSPITNIAKTLTKSLKGVQGGVSNLTNSFLDLKRVALSALSLTALIRVGKEMIKLSSDLIEVQNVVDTVFGDMSDDINEFAQSALKSFGLTELQAKNFVSVFGGLLEASDIVGDAQEEMSINLTKLAGDVASFYNMDYETAFDKLQSGLTGEVKAMRSFGVNMTIVNLEAWALANGITKSYTEMSQAEKTALRYNYMLDKLSNAQGDFNKTQGSWANQVRILSGQIQQLGAILGGFLQKILYPMLTVINQIIDMAISGATALSKMFGFDMESIQVQQGVAGSEAGVYLGDTGADAMEDLADSTDDAAEAQENLNNEQKKSLANLHDLNVLQSNETSSSVGSLQGTYGNTGLSFGLSQYKDITDTENPISELFKTLEDAVKKNDWSGVGSLLADKINSVFSGIDLSKYSTNIKTWVSSIAETLNSLTKNINFEEIGRVIGEGLSLVIFSVNTFFDTYDFSELGSKLASGLNTLINIVNWEEVGQFLINKFNSIFSLLAGFVTDFDFGNFASSLAETINSIISNLNVEDLSTALAGVIEGVVTTITTLIKEVDWKKIPIKVFDVLKKAIQKIDWTSLFVSIIDAHKSLPDEIALVLDGLLAYKSLSILIPIITSIVTALTNLKLLFVGGLISGSSLTFFENLGNAIALAEGEAGTFHEALVAVFGGVATNVTGVVSIIFGAVTAITNFIAMLKDGYNWVNEFIMIVGIAAVAVGAIIFGAPGVLAAAVAAVVTALLSAIVAIKDNWDNIVAVVSGALEAVGNFVVNAWNAIVSFISDVLNGLVTIISNIFNSIVSFISDVLNGLVTIISNIVNSIVSFISDVLNGLVTIISNIVNSITGLISNAVSGLANILSPALDTLKTLLDNIISFLTGGFKTAWTNAWEGIFGVFTSLFEGIGGIFEGIINTVISVINTIIGAINKISWDVPDWVPSIGGSTFGFDIPEIPKLAAGAVIPPNQEFIAVLGDQKRGVNIETPLDTMLQAFRLALSESSDYNGGDIIIPIYIDNELSSEEIIRKQDIARYRGNGK